MEASVSIPFLHIADATAERAREAGARRVGLLGTQFTMEEPFYRGRLKDSHGLDVLVPEERDRRIIHRVIYEALVLGKWLPGSREEYRRIIGSLVAGGAEGIILGGTEISLLVKAEDSPVPLFDTTSVHAAAAVEQSLLKPEAVSIPVQSRSAGGSGT